MEFADRVAQLTRTTGTGSFELAGSVTGYRTFSSAFSDGDTLYYCCENEGKTQWEVGIGTYSAGTLARTTVLSSSNGGSAVDFSAGNKTVFCTVAAAHATATQALVSGGGNGTLGQSTSGQVTNLIGRLIEVANFQAAKPTETSGGRAITVTDASALYSQGATGGTLTAGAGTNKAWYAQWDMGRSFHSLGCEFSFAAGSGGQSGVVAIIPWATLLTNPSSIPDTSLHLTISRWAYGVSSYSAGVATPIVSVGYLTRVLTAGTRYRAELRYQNGEVWLLLPNKQVVKLPAAAAANIGRYVCVEPYQSSGAADDMPTIHQAWASDADLAIHGEWPTLVESLGGTDTAATSDTPGYWAPTLSVDTDIPGLSLEVPAGNVVIELKIWVQSTSSGGCLGTFKYIDAGGLTSNASVWVAASGQVGFALVSQKLTLTRPQTLTFSVNPQGTGTMAFRLESSRACVATCRQVA